jgi:hypothetical protein
MLTRTVAALSVAVALAFSGSAAHAGFVRNVGRLAIVNAKLDALLLKRGVEGARNLGKDALAKDAALAHCLKRAASAKPCI